MVITPTNITPLKGETLESGHKWCPWFWKFLHAPVVKPKISLVEILYPRKEKYDDQQNNHLEK